MTTRAFDTIFIGKANRQLDNRKIGNALDRRLAWLESALRGDFTTRSNPKLNSEYFRKIPVDSVANDIVREFLVFIVDRADIIKKTNLTGGEWALAKKARWPSHDRHLLAAVVGAKKPGVFVTENAHVAVSDAVQRLLGISVIGVL